MQFITYDQISGQIDGVRSAGGCNTPQDLLKAVYGPDAYFWGAIPYDGRDLTGLMVDSDAGALVPDPAYVPPPPPAAPVSPADEAEG